MPRNLALHEATVDDGLELRQGVGVIAKRGIAKLLNGSTVIREARMIEIVELRTDRVYAIRMVEGVDWIVERRTGCTSCGPQTETAGLAHYRG